MSSGAHQVDHVARSLWTPRERRQWARELSDLELLAALREQDPVAFSEFERRFRPLLETLARTAGIPDVDWAACVDEVLEDAMLHLSHPKNALPGRLAGYLVQAARYRHANLRRNHARRVRWHDLLASGPEGAEPIVLLSLSAAAVRESEGEAYVAESAESGAATPPDRCDAVARFAAKVDAALTDEERQLLTWVAEDVPRRLIAEWLGAGYEATRKQIQRLTMRLRAAAVEQALVLSPQDQRDVLRFLRRAGVCPSGRSHLAAQDEHRARTLAKKEIIR
jgi:hypothetical protein